MIAASSLKKMLSETYMSHWSFSGSIALIGLTGLPKRVFGINYLQTSSLHTSVISSLEMKKIGPLNAKILSLLHFTGYEYVRFSNNLFKKEG